MNGTIHSTGHIEVHALSAPERRLLLEMLASERAGEDALDVLGLGRDRVADRLCTHWMSRWVSSREIVFTSYGRHVAESLALRLVHQQPRLCC